MGLDITAYKNLRKIENPELDEYGYPVDYESEWKPGDSMKWSEKYFPGRGEGVNADTTYSYEESFSFRAGSYSGYNWWRRHLEELSKDTLDFDELINFADNEGVIGPIVSKKLLEDFNKNKEKAKEYSKTIEDGDYWLEKYEAWLDAFEYAADNGAVDFH